ncbi:hypothetical protein X768_31520 [Mesorhizobium sp. LSJC265A00]|nr:hypothetical protein X768_31520 [Mesorhizobium sp. LSJC265A00]
MGGTQRRHQRGFDRPALRRVLPERVGDCGQPGLLPVAAKHVAVADLSGREPNCGAGDRRFTDIEGCAAAADATTHGDQTGFRATQKLGLGGQAGLVPEPGDVVAVSLRQRCHDVFALGLFPRFLSSHWVTP